MTSPTLLGTGGHGASGYQKWNSADSYYSNVGLGRSAMMDTGFTTESYVGQIVRVPGTISYLSWGVSAEFGVTLTLALNANSSGTALAISIGPTVIGLVTDSTHSVTVSSGDVLEFVTNVSANKTDYQGSFYCVSARFDATTSSAQMLATVGPSTISPTTTQQFIDFLGIAGVPTTTGSDKQFYCLAAGIWQNMACYLESNGFSRATTVTNRINNSNGSMAISIPTSTTGSFEDTTHSDSVSAGDLLDYGFILGSSEPGTGSFTMVWIGAHFLATDTTLCMIGGSNGQSAQILSPDTKYTSLFGGGSFFPPGTGGMPRATGLFPYALTASSYTNHVTCADMGSGVATFTLLINGNASALAISSNGNTGYITDDTHMVGFDVGDTCANSILVTSGTGTYIDWASAAVLLQASST